MQLPKNFNYYSVEPDGANVYVSGDTVTGGRCAAVTVGQAPLRIRSHGVQSCARASAHAVHPVIARDPKSFEARVRIARGASLGPVVMRFQEVSDTHLQWTYGPGTLWLFDAATTNGTEVLQVSATTGRVENVVRLPRLFRPLLAADADGLWLAIAPNGGAGPGPSPIYRLAPGARAPALVHRGGRAALWLVAAGHTVWADVLTGTTHGEIWRFDGPSGKGRALARADELDSWAAGVSRDGSSLWTVREVPVGGSYESCSAVRVLEIDGQTGRQSVAASISTPGAQCYSVTSSTYAGGAFYFLLDTRLYRVSA